MAQQMYISGSEIEAEPDNDSDDVSVAKGNYQSNSPGNLAVVMEDTLSTELSSHSAATISQDILNNLGTTSGLALTGAYVTTPSGGLEVTAKDSTGAVTSDVIINADGSTFDAYYGSTINGTALNGGEWATTVSYPSSSGFATIQTAEFNANQINVANDFINESGTSLSTKWAMNTDGSQTFMSAAPVSQTGAPEATGGTSKPESPAVLFTIGEDSFSYGVDKAIEYAAEHSISPAVRAASDVISKVMTTYELGKTGVEIGSLVTDLASEYNNNQDMSKTATQLSAKIAVGALQVYAAATGQPAVSALAERFVQTSVDIGNAVVGAAIDKYFVWKDTQSTTAVGNVTRHPSTQMTLPDMANAALAASSVTTDLAQRALYTWAGLDTAGFAGVQFPGAGVQDMTANQTKVVLAAYSGASGTWSFSDTSNHSLRVTASEAGMSSKTGNGNDTFVVAAPDQTLDGGGGGNTVVFSGNKADYRLSSGSGKVVVIDKNATRDGVSTLANIQTLTFADGNLSPASATITATNTIGVFRFFDTVTGTHFFSSSATEVAGVQATRSDLKFEGAGFQSQDPTNKDTSDTAVYRFFDTTFGTHFYTASLTEKNTVQSTRADLKFEGTGFYEHTTAQPGDNPVYRFFDTVHGTHFYTDNAGERATILSTRADLKDEGVGFYAPSYKFG